MRAIVWDTEFLSADGALRRLWMGPGDPDPVLVQIGAVALSLNGDYAVADRFSRLVIPRDRTGKLCGLDPYFSRLTGLTDAEVNSFGVELLPALEEFAGFCGGDPLWSWGKDEFFAIAISCYLVGVPAPIRAGQCGNAATLLLRAGVPLEDIHATRSSALAGYFGLETGDLNAHDAVDDALSIARALQLLLRQGRLTPADFLNPHAAA